MILQFEGAAPDEAEIAAMLVALQAGQGDVMQASGETPSPWQLAMRYPDLDRDDLRALAQGGTRVF
ncbi:MAG: hypothetical protein NVSMB31_06530 [Vulcanimicrobiaceae bacterium]